MDSMHWADMYSTHRPFNPLDPCWTVVAMKQEEEKVSPPMPPPKYEADEAARLGEVVSRVQGTAFQFATLVNN